MSVQQTQVRSQGGCQNITKVTVDGQDLQELKKLVVDVMKGGPAPDDGLQEIVSDLTARAQGKPAMPVQTVAVKKWIDGNRALYARLAKFQLQATVQDCRTSVGICKMTEDKQAPASPDIYLNMVYLLERLQSSSSASLTYYIYDKSQKHCAFFGLHQGALTFVLNQQCR